MADPSAKPHLIPPDSDPRPMKRKGRPKDDGDYGAGDKTTTSTKRIGVSCSSCTYLNRAGATFCEMCYGIIDFAKCYQLSFDSQDGADIHSSNSKVTAEHKEGGSATALGEHDGISSILATTTGRAFSFVEQVVQLQAKLNPEFEKIKKDNHDLKAVAVDDMVALAEKMIELQNQFRSGGKDHKVTIGYHYTFSRHLDSIRRDGLMSGLEQVANGINSSRGGRMSSSKRRGGAFGHGIYTGTNPFAFQKFGDVGLIVAVMKGNLKRVQSRDDPSGVEADTVIGNKQERHSGCQGRKPYHDEVILRQSGQCLPLICYSTAMLVGQFRVEDSPAAKLVWRYHRELQCLVNEFFNDGDKVEAIITQPPKDYERRLGPFPVNSSALQALSVGGTLPPPVAKQNVVSLGAACPPRLGQNYSIRSSATGLTAVPPITRPSSSGSWAGTASASLLAAFNAATAVEHARSTSQRAWLPSLARNALSPAQMVNIPATNPMIQATQLPQVPMNGPTPVPTTNASLAPLQTAFTDQFQKHHSALGQPSPTVGLNAAPGGSRARPAAALDPKQLEDRKRLDQLIGGRHALNATQPKEAKTGDFVARPPQRTPTPLVPPQPQPATAGNDTASRSTGSFRRLHRKSLPPMPGTGQPLVTRGQGIEGNYSYIAPTTLELAERSYSEPTAPQASEECSVCLSSMLDSVVKLVKCGHCFHGKCLEDSLKHHRNCPICRKPVVEPQGTSPSGSMSVSVTPQKCRGFEDCGTICINYRMSQGRQLTYHPNPGVRYGPTRRVAYVPDNDEGRMLLKRLKYAFVHGLTFSVGTSFTTGRSNVIVWASIHHKTSVGGGAHGYPDPNYFMNCNEEMDVLGVPRAECIDELGSS